MKKEKWRKVAQHVDYEVSNKGRVRTLKFSDTPKILSLFTVKGYSKVNFSINGKFTQMSVHRVVAIAFIENSKNKPIVNHIDGDKSNNFLENLEWATSKENINKHFVLNHDEDKCFCCIQYKKHIKNLEIYGRTKN